jgi:putative hydrolase of the HAD superfamily
VTRPPTCPALVIDLDGVLRSFDPAVTALIEDRAGLPAGVIGSFAFHPQLLDPAITGAMADELWRYRVAEELAGLFGDGAAADAVTEWAAYRGEIDPDVLGLVRRVTVPVVLLTNATTRLEADLSAAGLDGEFAAVVSSARTGVVKPDERAFAAAEQVVTRISPDRTGPIVYIDDDAGHIRAARARGWRVWRFTGADRMRAFLDRQHLLAPSDDFTEPPRGDVEDEAADGVAEGEELTRPDPRE